jgi:hypothetical protein
MENRNQDTRDDVSKNVDDLCELIRKLPIASTLSNVALRTYMIEPSSVFETETLSISAEYVTWLFVSLNKSEPTPAELNDVVAEDHIERLRDLTNKIIQSAKEYSYAEREKNVQIGDRIDDILVATRIANMSIRGEAYPHHLAIQLHSLFDPFSSELKSKLGFDIGEAVAIYESLMKMMNDRTQRLVSLFLRDSEIKSLQLDHMPTRPELRELRNEFLRSAFKEIRPSAHEIFLVTCDEVSQASHCDPFVVRSFLEFFTICFGQSDSTGGRPTVHEALEQAPFLKLSSDRWLVHLVIYSIFRFRSAIEKALEGNAALWNRYEEHRSQYLERHAVDLIKSTSVHASGWTHLKYDFDDGDGLKAFELDGLVLIDQTAFLIEAKAGGLTPAARRGSRSAFDQIKRLVDEAQQQSARAARYLRSVEDGCFRSSNGIVRIRGKKLSRIYLLSVTLDSLNAFTAHKSWLLKAGIVKRESAWSVYDLDLQVVTELIRGAGEFVGFLEFRLAADNIDQFLITEELDWLGLFFNLGGQPIRQFNRKVMMVGDWAHYINDYYAGIVPGNPAIQKPRLLISATMAMLIKAVEKIGSPGFIDAIVTLLSLTPEERECFTRRVDELWRRRINRKVLGFRMLLADGSVLCYTISRKMFKGYAKLAKYEFRADLAICIREKSKGEAQACVERYPWREDANMKETIRKFRERTQSHSRPIVSG